MLHNAKKPTLLLADDMPDSWVEIELSAQVDSDSDDEEDAEGQEGCAERDIAAPANAAVFDCLQEQGRMTTAQQEFQHWMRPRRACRKD